MYIVGAQRCGCGWLAVLSEIRSLPDTDGDNGGIIHTPDPDGMADTLLRRSMHGD